MRVGVMHWAFPPVVGGVESHLLYLYRELAAKKHAISFLTAPHPARDDMSSTWCRIVSDPLMDLHRLKDGEDTVRYERVYALMEKFIGAERPDIIHAHNFHYFTHEHAFCLDELARKYGIPTVLTIHNYWHDDLCRSLLRDVGWDRIVAVSYFMKKPCLFDAGVSPEKVEVHYHGVDLERYRAAPDREEVKDRLGLKGKKVVFHPARACRSKGTLHAIEAVSMLKGKYPDICIIVSGLGDTVDFEGERPAFRTDVKSLVDRLGMEPHVIFINATGEEMPDYMNSSDVILYPTIMPQGEAFGIAPVEAMACGRPVIVTNSGGLTESTYPGINGLVVDKDPRGLVEALAKNIDSLLSDEKYAAYLGQNGRQIAEERFDAKAMAARMESLYYRLLDEKASQRTRAGKNVLHAYE